MTEEEIKTKIKDLANPHCQYVDNKKLGKGVFYSYDNTEAWLNGLTQFIVGLLNAKTQIK